MAYMFGDYKLQTVNHGLSGSAGHVFSCTATQRKAPWLRRWTPRSSAPDSTAYVMERMGFGLSVAPKFFDGVVKWTLRDFEGVDNYIRVPNAMVAAVEAELSKYGLVTKPADPFLEMRVLGLQLEDHAVRPTSGGDMRRTRVSVTLRQSGKCLAGLAEPLVTTPSVDG